LLFVGPKKYQETYLKTRKVTVFYKALTVEKKDIFGNGLVDDPQDSLALSRSFKTPHVDLFVSVCFVVPYFLVGKPRRGVRIHAVQEGFQLGYLNS
jgi:hypothetical protein